LRRNVERNRSDVDCFDFIAERVYNEKTRADGLAFSDASKTEDDRPLVFRDDLYSAKKKNRENNDAENPSEKDEKVRACVVIRSLDFRIDLCDLDFCVF